MSLIGIAGPIATGKSTLADLLIPTLPIDSIIIRDIYDAAYDKLIEDGQFTEFKEITKDRDYFLIYVYRVVDYLCNMVDAYKDYPGLVIFDGTTYDLLIYSMLNLWYHYPSRGLQEEMIERLLKYRDAFDVIYMTNADDSNFSLEKKTKRQYNTGFFKNRATELAYYDIFRELPKIVTLPSTSVLSCEEFILEDLRSRNLLV